MVIGFKDASKFIGIIILTLCAVLVCNLFLNYDLDLRAVESGVGEQAKELYKALRLNNVVVCSVSGGCLVMTSVVMLVFYIWKYIENNGAKFGILKALGYSDLKISLSCWVFGLCVFIGAVVGLAISWAIMPSFYRAQNSDVDGIPTVVLKFHIILPMLLMILPSVIFSALSVGIAYFKIKLPALSLIKGNMRKDRKKIRYAKEDERSFLRGLAFSVLRDKKSLAFFVAFGCFCFSAMMQMGLSMRDYASDMMGIMILVIGIVLAATSLFLALSTVVGGNAKTVAMLKVNGYTFRETSLAVLGLYHIPALIGFAVGCVYQWGLLNIMVNLVFSSFDNVPVYSFDWAMFGVCAAVFFVAYEGLNLYYSLKISSAPIKSIMAE